MKTRKNTCRIVRRADQQGTRLPGQDSPGIEKYATESNSSLKKNPTPGPTDPPTTKHRKEKRKRWSREEYKEVMYCFYYALEKLKQITLRKILLHGAHATVRVTKLKD